MKTSEEKSGQKSDKVHFFGQSMILDKIKLLHLHLLA